MQKYTNPELTWPISARARAGDGLCWVNSKLPCLEQNKDQVMWVIIIIIIIVNLYWGCQHHRKSGLQKGPLKVTTNQYNYVKM